MKFGLVQLTGHNWVSNCQQPCDSHCCLLMSWPRCLFPWSAMAQVQHNRCLTQHHVAQPWGTLQLSDTDLLRQKLGKKGINSLFCSRSPTYPEWGFRIGQWQLLKISVFSRWSLFIFSITHLLLTGTRAVNLPHRTLLLMLLCYHTYLGRNLLGHSQ